MAAHRHSQRPHTTLAAPRALHVPLVLAIVGLSGCLEDLPDPTRVDDLRVLAVRAEPPEVSPGATVALDALVVDPLGRPRTYAWYACIVADQGAGFFGGGGETSTSGGRGTALSDDPYGDSCIRRYEAGERWAMKLGEEPTATFEVPDDLFDSQDALKAAYGLSEDLTIPAEVELGFLGIAGMNYTVTLVVEVDGRRIETQKRVNISRDLQDASNRPNLNPDQPSIHVADRELKVEAPKTAAVPSGGRCFLDDTAPLAAGRTFNLTPINFPDPPIDYLVLLAGTTTDEPFEIVEREEVLFYSFFATRGSLSKEVSKSTGEPQSEFRLKADEAGPTDVWVVVRDGRGGTSWCHEPLVALP